MKNKSSTEDWEKEFDKKCLLTTDGKCKYWDPVAFGYDKNDREAPLDKFFPEEIKSFLRYITHLSDNK